MDYQFDITNLEFRLIRDYVYSSYGIFIKDDRISLMKTKLYPRLLSLGLASYGEYFHYVKYQDRDDREKGMMIAALTNNETYFFREYPQLEVLRDSILPMVREENLAADNRTLTILSAGCSTGEEVYSLAHLTLESGAFLWNWDVHIIGGDISGPALEKARSGLYEERALRFTDPEHAIGCFDRDDEKYQVKKRLAKHTNFVKLNLIDESTWRNFKNIDIVLCRNVLIYFSSSSFKKAVENIHNALRPGGFLLLGHSETLTQVTDDFIPERFSKTVIYRKRGR